MVSSTDAVNVMALKSESYQQDAILISTLVDNLAWVQGGDSVYDGGNDDNLSSEIILLGTEPLNNMGVINEANHCLEVGREAKKFESGAYEAH